MEESKGRRRLNKRIKGKVTRQSKSQKKNDNRKIKSQRRERREGKPQKGKQKKVERQP